MNAPFNIDRESPPAIGRDRDLLRVVVRELSERLPAGWGIETRRPPSDGNGDALLEVSAPGGERGRLAVDLKLTLEPRDVSELSARLRAPENPGDTPTPMVAARFISPRTRELLDAAGIWYADATGNVRVALERPGLLVETRGADVSPWRVQRDLLSLKGRAAARIVRALCDFAPPVGVRELAQRADASAGSTVRTLDLLWREALITRDERKHVTGVDLAGLVSRWSQDFRFTQQNAILRCFEPRRLSELLPKLRNVDGDYAVTGSFAAGVLAPYAEARLLVLYADDVQGIADRLGVREPRGQSNVWIASPRDDLPFERSWERDGLRYAAPSQVACDLFDLPGRSPAEAEELLRFMESNPDAWRPE